MRIDAGFGRRLANADTFGGDRFPRIDVDSDAFNDGPEDRKRELDPVERIGVSYAPENLEREPGIETRRPVHEVTWLVRPFGAWTPDSFTGAKAAIGLRPGDAGQAPGNMQPWDNPRRTLRALPLVPWDAGTAVGPQ